MSRPGARRAYAATEHSTRVEKGALTPIVDPNVVAKISPSTAHSHERIEHSREEEVQKRFIPIVKADSEKRHITGIVLVPELVDAHGDIYDADVIAEAAHDFLARYNDTSTLGLMHKDMKRDFDLLESWTAPSDLSIGTTIVKQGTWVITMRVNEDKIWNKVKKGEITGFSIGGKAKVEKLAE